MNQPTLPPLLQLLQLVARRVVSLTATAAGFVVLFLPSLWTGPM
ncbi:MULTISPECIES: hypothetical protein [Micrococcus]|nr:hypothetical protein [Micrococcus yunnanensis]WHM16727.1 hypothetical protein QL063_00660 [Micrococcus yunnanensis]